MDFLEISQLFFSEILYRYAGSPEDENSTTIGNIHDVAHTFLSRTCENLNKTWADLHCLCKHCLGFNSKHCGPVGTKNWRLLPVRDGYLTAESCYRLHRFNTTKAKAKSFNILIDSVETRAFN